jgi:hypothetical protein
MCQQIRKKWLLSSTFQILTPLASQTDFLPFSKYFKALQEASSSAIMLWLTQLASLLVLLNLSLQQQSHGICYTVLDTCTQIQSA